jgi:hypothetical protein
MTLVGYGERGSNPARKQSFVITEALEETASLEDFCGAWEQDPPVTGAGIRLKRELIKRIAGVSRLMHSNGINHRDYYICHFLLDISADVLTMLYFSSMRIGLTWHDIYRFMSEYRDKPLRDTLAADARFWSRCRLRAYNLYHSFYHEFPAAD